MDGSNYSLVDAMADPEMYRSRLTELEAEAKTRGEAKREAEASVVELTRLLELIDGPLGEPLRALMLELKRREQAVSKQEARIADLESRLATMRKLTSDGSR